MSRSFIRTATTRLGVLAAVATFAGCSAGYTTDNNSTVLLILAAINGGTPLQSDVIKDGTTILSDSVKVSVAVRFKNRNITVAPSIPSAVIVDRYEVRYRRSDGRGVEGQDVPYTISGNIAFAFDVKTSGTDDVLIEVVRGQAKLEPPLRNLQGAVKNALGGAFILTVFADITLHGHTISGQAVSGTGTLQIDFADYGS